MSSLDERGPPIGSSASQQLQTETVETRGLLIGLMLTFGVALGVYATAASEIWAAVPPPCF